MSWIRPRGHGKELARDADDKWKLPTVATLHGYRLTAFGRILAGFETSSPVKGLTSRKTAEAIATFVKQHGALGPRRAVLCTYNLSPARFEAVVLPELARPRRWFRTLVLADAAALQQDGVLGAQRAAASTYELAPVRLKGPGVFHPKLIVLQAGARVLVGIGSGNLTPGGLGGNLELMLFASNDSPDGRALAGSAIQFLHDLPSASAS